MGGESLPLKPIYMKSEQFIDKALSADGLQDAINKVSNTYISDEIIEACFKEGFLTPNVFIDIAHKICDRHNLKNPVRNNVITDARLYLKNNHYCYSQV